MKRSEINRIIREGTEFLRQHRFALPPFAYWTPQDWRARGHECDEIRRAMLGWDVTDFGSGRFEERGALLFTLRNGNPQAPAASKAYCEKVIIVCQNQLCPTHCHAEKVEDIINRAGGELVLQLHASGVDGRPDPDAAVHVSVDGTAMVLPAGGRVRMEAGQSICLTRGLYHSLRAEGGPVLIGEVSSVNDDETDNRFAEPIDRFPRIEEDEPILHYLCNEYPAAG